MLKKGNLVYCFMSLFDKNWYYKHEYNKLLKCSLELMKIFVYKESLLKIEFLIQSMSRRKYNKMISNIEDFCSNKVENERIVKVGIDIYFYRIDMNTRLIFSIVGDNIILYDNIWTE